MRWRKRRSAPQPEPQAKQENPSIEDLGRQAVERARRAVEKVGSHFFMVGGSEKSAGFLFTIGLWQTYQHPELILFAPAQNPAGMEGRLSAVAERVARGERFEARKLYPELFGKHPGTLREVQAQWYPAYLGTASAFYESFDFPALQLFWPDGQSLFPWENGFARVMFTSPLLWEKNAVLANVGLEAIQQAQAGSQQPLLPNSLGELLFQPDAARGNDLLEDWRWLIGPRLSLFCVTTFGDLILKSPEGHIHWLDTGSALHDEIGASEEEAIEMICRYPVIFFHANTLLAARESDWKPQEGQVYSWRQPPMLGGEESLDNLDFVPLAVHVSNLGRTAFAIKDLPEGSEISGVDFRPLG